MSRGDRRLGKVIYRAWQMGAVFDAWEEHFKYELWQKAFEEAGLDIKVLRTEGTLSGRITTVGTYRCGCKPRISQGRI